MSEPQDSDADTEPGWLQAMRSAAVQRPRTQFVKIRWALLQPLLRERDALWAAASPETRLMVEAMRQADNYSYVRRSTLFPRDGEFVDGKFVPREPG